MPFQFARQLAHFVGGFGQITTIRFSWHLEEINQQETNNDYYKYRKAHKQKNDRLEHSFGTNDQKQPDPSPLSRASTSRSHPFYQHTSDNQPEHTDAEAHRRLHRVCSVI